MSSEIDIRFDLSKFPEPVYTIPDDGKIRFTYNSHYFEIDESIIDVDDFIGTKERVLKSDAFIRFRELDQAGKL